MAIITNFLKFLFSYLKYFIVINYSFSLKQKIKIKNPSVGRSTYSAPIPPTAARIDTLGAAASLEAARFDSMQAAAAAAHQEFCQLGYLFYIAWL